MTKAKPCPFCGGMTVHMQQGGNGYWYCWCDRCGAQTRETTTKIQAKKLWNRRTP